MAIRPALLNITLWWHPDEQRWALGVYRLQDVAFVPDDTPVVMMDFGPFDGIVDVKTQVGKILDMTMPAMVQGS